MSERDWLNATDPDRMLRLLNGKASDRKLRLFAVACCRRVWPLLPDARSRAAVEVAERYADGLANPVERATARASALAAPERAGWAVYWAASHNAAETVANARMVAAEAVAQSAALAARATGADQAAAWDDAAADAVREQADLLRDLFGNPFRPAAVDPSWLTWHGGTVGKLARAIYEGRRFDDMPILADALEEAGCADAAILAHCRQPRAHARGCWVVDAVLGKR